MTDTFKVVKRARLSPKPKPVKRATLSPKPKPKKRIYRIEATNRSSGYGNNINIDVAAYTLEGAIEAFRTAYPEAKLIKVMADRLVDQVIIAKEKPPAWA